jgi:hypothetical protein
MQGWAATLQNHEFTRTQMSLHGGTKMQPGCPTFTWLHKIMQLLRLRLYPQSGYFQRLEVLSPSHGTALPRPQRRRSCVFRIDWAFRRQMTRGRRRTASTRAMRMHLTSNTLPSVERTPRRMRDLSFKARRIKTVLPPAGESGLALQLMQPMSSSGN